MGPTDDGRVVGRTGAQAVSGRSIAIGSLGNRRGLWVFLFLIFGLPALFSAMVLPFNPPSAVPWVVLTWTVVAVSGYRIWRIDHPYESAERNIARRLCLLLSFAGGFIGLVIVQAYPLVLVVVLAVWFVVMALLGLALRSISRGVKEE